MEFHLTQGSSPLDSVLSKTARNTIYSNNIKLVKWCLPTALDGPVHEITDKDLPKSPSVQPITMFSSSASLEELVTKLGALVHRRGELTSIREEMSQIYLEFRNMLATTEQSITENRQYQEGLREQWNSALDNLRYNEESVPSDFQERRSAVLSRARDEGRRMQYERTTVNADIAAAREKLRAMDAKIGVLDARIQELRNEIERIGHGSR